jgi:hypothetical protein
MDRFGNKKKKGEKKSSRPSQRAAKTETNGNGNGDTPEEAPKRGQSSPSALSALEKMKAEAESRKAKA